MRLRRTVSGPASLASGPRRTRSTLGRQRAFVRGRPAGSAGRTASTSIGRTASRSILRFRNGEFLPQEYHTRLIYSDSANIAPALTTYSDKIWNLNSVYDPDQSGAGHQPHGYDQLAALYSRYRVKGVYVELEARQRANHGLQVALLPNNSTAGILMSQALESPEGATQVITSSNASPVLIKRYFDCAQITGVSRATYMADDRYQAQVGSNPSEAICLHQLAASVDGVTYNDYEFVMRMTFNVVFFDRIQQVGS